MKKDTAAKLLRVYMGESDNYRGKPTHKYILEFLRKQDIAGATVFRGISGYGKTSIIHTTSIVRMSSDLPIMIEIVDTVENIERIKPELAKIARGGLITEENVTIISYEGESK